MNEDIRQLWIAALQSGTYAHGKWLLRNHADEYCPLGVLCALHALHAAHTGGEDGWKKRQTGEEASWCYLGGTIAVAQKIANAWRYLGAATAAPQNVLEWAELERGDAQEIMRSNDNFCTSFDRSITYIQEI